MIAADGPVGRCRQAAADHLAQRRQVGSDSVKSLRTAIGDPEAGHHFVENKQAAILVRQFAERREIAGLGRDRAMLPAIGSISTAAILAGNRARTSDTALTLLNGQRMVSCTAPAVTPGYWVCRAWLPRSRPGPEGVDVPVVVARHLDDFGSASDAPCHPNCRHGRLCSGGNEPYFFDRGNRSTDRLGDLDLPHRGRTKAEPSSRAATTADRTWGCTWPRIIGPHEPM